MHSIDDELLEHFYSIFPEYKFDEAIAHLNEDDMKSKGGKERWRSFIMPVRFSGYICHPPPCLWAVLTVTGGNRGVHSSMMPDAQDGTADAVCCAGLEFLPARSWPGIHWTRMRLRWHARHLAARWAVSRCCIKRCFGGATS